MAQQATIESLNEESDVEHAIAGLVERARAAMRGFAGASQAELDEAVTALAWSLYRPETARELAEYAVESHRPRQCREQDHQEPAQDLRHAAGPDAGQVDRHHRGNSREGSGQICQARWRRRGGHAVDQSFGDARQQGDDGGQGRQRDHHRALAARLACHQCDRRVHAVRAERRSAHRRTWFRSSRTPSPARQPMR